MDGGFDYNSVKSMREGDGRSMRAALLALNTMLVLGTIFLFWWDRRTVPLIDIVVTLLLFLEVTAHWVWVRDQEKAEHKPIPPIDDETAQAYYHKTKTKRREQAAQTEMGIAYRVIKHNERRETDEIADAEYAYPGSLADDEALDAELPNEDMRGVYIGEDGEIYNYQDGQRRRASQQ